MTTEHTMLGRGFLFSPRTLKWVPTSHIRTAHSHCKSPYGRARDKQRMPVYMVSASQRFTDHSTAPAVSTYPGEFRALVLDSSYRPIDVISWQRAICLDLFNKVDVLEYYEHQIRSAYDIHFIPAVLRVRLYVARGRRPSNITVSRRNVMLRDRNECQYCGTDKNLTIDHIVPKSKGGAWDWLNLVTACTVCNGKKGEKSLKQLKWKLRTQPRVPNPYELGVLLGIDLNIQTPPKEWTDYLYELKRYSRSAADEELTSELEADTLGS